MEGYLAQVLMFGGSFAPMNWMFCNGQLLPISSYSALFSIIGTTYGGDGKTTFALPDLRGRVPLSSGQGPGLSNRALGARVGEEGVQLTVNEIPAHHHFPQGSSAAGNAQDPLNNVNADEGNQNFKLYQTAANGTMMQTTDTGGNLPHDNMQPSLVVNYIICVNGIFPSRG